MIRMGLAGSASGGVGAARSEPREVTRVPFLVARRLGSDLVAGPADLRWCGQQQDGEVQARSGKIERAEEGGGARLVGSEGGDGLDWIGGKRGGWLVGSTLKTRRVAAAWGWDGWDKVPRF